MSGETGLYELLYELWMKERESSGLIALPKDLEGMIRDYVAQAKAYLRVSDKKSLSARLREAELQAVKKLAEELFTLRMEKIVKHAKEGRPSENLYGPEHQLYESLRRAITEYRERVKTLVEAAAYPDWRPIEARYELVAFLQDFPQIVGEDLETYGPFRKGDIAVLPPGNARALESRGVVRRIRVGEPAVEE